MKGLMLKDLMCLRKQLILFAYTVVSVFVLSTMFVLSARFGNLAGLNHSMMVENNLSEMDIKNISVVALILFMFLPIAVAGDVAAIFRMDGKAGFSKVDSALPVPVHRRVLAKYLTIFVMFGIGAAVDIAISFVLSRLTDIISFGDFLGIIISAASLMSIYGALVIFFCFLLGYGKEDYAIIVSWAVILAVALLVNLDRVKGILASIGAGDAKSVGFFSDLIDFILHKYFILFAVAVIVITASYLVSVSIAKRKRGAV